MKKMTVYKQIFQTLIVLLALLMILSGCGGSSGGSSTVTVKSTTYNVDNVSFNMQYVPKVTSFPTGLNDLGSATIDKAYWMAETEVTYQLWSKVYSWASANGYKFANSGKAGAGIQGSITIIDGFPTGHDTDPVTEIEWDDAIVWCNALTEYLKTQGKSLTCVYTAGGYPIRDATDDTTCNAVVLDANANGFRLPTVNEWQMAGRYKGLDNSDGAVLKDDLYWTPGSYASGSRDTVSDYAADKEVAWYLTNSNTPDPTTNTTHPVGKNVGILWE